MSNCLYFYGDILGYRNLLDKYGTYEFHNIIKNLIQDVENSIIDENDRSYPTFRNKITKVYDKKIEYFFAFDTLIVYIQDIKNDDIKKLLGIFSKFIGLIYLKLLGKYNIKLRGLITSTDEYFFENNIVTLKNISQAFDREKILNLPIITLMIDSDPLEYSWIGTRVNSEIFFYYDTPIKGEIKTEEFLVLNLGQTDLLKEQQKDNISLGDICENIENEINQTKVEDIRVKLINTIDYLKKNIHRRELAIYQVNDEKWEEHFDKKSLEAIGWK